jgi:Domain of unknown function (DUF6089)
MHPTCKTLLVVAMIVGLCHQESAAQFVPSKFEFGISAGTMIYQGDLSAGYLGYIQAPKPAFGLQASDYLDPYFSLRANLLVGRIGADESTYSSPAWRRERNFKFTSSVVEFSTELVWDLYGKTYQEGFRRFSPYLFAGLGFALLNVQRDWSSFNYAYFGPKASATVGLGIDTLHKSPSIIPVIPLGLGLRYMVTNQFSVNLEGAFRLTGSDYIDGFKYAADPTRNDHYYSITLGLSYRLGINQGDCPKPVL